MGLEGIRVWQLVIILVLVILVFATAKIKRITSSKREWPAPGGKRLQDRGDKKVEKENVLEDAGRSSPPSEDDASSDDGKH